MSSVDAAACTPASGSATLTAGCGSLNLAVLQHSGASTTLVLTGTLGFGGATQPTCAAVDGVDILDGTTVVQHLSSVTTLATNSILEILATGSDPVSDITSRCSSNDATERLDPYGIVITGRATGGTFTATCGNSTLGTSWPPALVVTCHSNVDEPAVGGSVSVQASTFMGMPLVQTLVNADAPHGAGGSVTAVDSSMFVIPIAAVAFGATVIAPFDTTGWMTSATEATNFTMPTSFLALDMTSNPFPSALCPPASMTAPSPETPPPPVFLGRITGANGHGSFSTEALFNGCQVETITAP